MKLTAFLLTAGIALGALLPMPAIASRPGHGAHLSLRAPESAETETNLLFAVQTAPGVAVTLRTRFAGHRLTQTRRTGRHGRAEFPYKAPFRRHGGNLRVTARAVIAGHVLSVSRTVHVHPFVPTVGVANIQVLHQTHAGWAPAAEVHAGELVRLTASYGVTELAGSFFPPCVSGMLKIMRDAKVLFSALVQCPNPQPPDSQPYVYVDLRLTGTLGMGSLDAEFDLRYDEGKYGMAHGSGTMSFSVIPGASSAKHMLSVSEAFRLCRASPGNIRVTVDGYFVERPGIVGELQGALASKRSDVNMGFTEA